jgi:hypothetical protein
MRFWLKQILIALDQLANAFLKGWADETISARCFRCSDRNPYKQLRKIIDKVLFWDRKGTKRHCELSYESEINRRHSPPEERNHAKSS